MATVNCKVTMFQLLVNAHRHKSQIIKYLGVIAVKYIFHCLASLFQFWTPILTNVMELVWQYGKVLNNFKSVSLLVVSMCIYLI